MKDDYQQVEIDYLQEFVDYVIGQGYEIYPHHRCQSEPCSFVDEQQLQDFISRFLKGRTYGNHQES